MSGRHDRRTAGTMVAPYRWVAVVAPLVAAAVLVVESVGYRRLEALTTAKLTSGLGLHSRPLPGTTMLVLWTSPHYGNTPVALNVTAECTAVWLIAPILIISAAITAYRGVTKRALIGCIVATIGAVATVALVNIVRLVVIVFSTREWGLKTGFEASHTVVGSLLSVVGVGIAALVYVRVAKTIGRRSSSAPEKIA